MSLINRFTLHLIDQIILQNKTERRFVEFLKTLVMEVARDPVQFVYDNFNNVKMDKFDNPTIPTDEMQHNMLMPSSMHNSMSNIPNSIGNNLPNAGMLANINANADYNMNMNNNANSLNAFNDARGRKRVAITEE